MHVPQLFHSPFLKTFHLLIFVFFRIPFTIQRLCELLTEPKRNYTGTDKFLRGVEKVCCVQGNKQTKLWEFILFLPCFLKVLTQVSAPFKWSIFHFQNVMVVSCVCPTSEWVQLFPALFDCFVNGQLSVSVFSDACNVFKNGSLMHPFFFTGKKGQVVWTEWTVSCSLATL